MHAKNPYLHPDPWDPLKVPTRVGVGAENKNGTSAPYETVAFITEIIPLKKEADRRNNGLTTPESGQD